MSGFVISASTTHPTTHLPAKRRRGRPRKTPRLPSSLSPVRSRSPAATPALAKRRKLSQASQVRPDDIFAVKDIVDEKFVDGKRFFKIDWEDNSATGESFEPTWVSPVGSSLALTHTY